MRLAVQREAFLTALTRVAKISPSNPSNQVLGFAKIEVSSGEMFVSATDLATRIIAQVAGPLRIEEPGACLLPVTPLMLALRASSAAFVGLALPNPNEVQMGIGRTTYRWRTLLADHFPDILTLNTEAETHVLGRDGFLSAINAVRSAIPRTADARFDQIGIQNGMLQAADGVRFHQVFFEDVALVEATLPVAFVTDVVSLLGASNVDKFTLGLSADKLALSVQAGNVTLMSRAHAEPFPDIDPVFTSARMLNEQPVEIVRDELMAAVRRVRMLADTESGAVTLRLQTGPDPHVTVSARQQSGSQASESLPIVYSGAERTLVVHHDHLSQLLAMFHSESVTLMLGPDSRAKPSSIYIASDSRIGVITQLRLGWHDDYR